MRLVTIPDNIDKVTATVKNETPDLGSAVVDIAHGAGHDSITVATGTSVTYTATPNGSAIFTGWVDENKEIVSDKETYETTVAEDLKLTAVFENLNEITINSENASANSEMNPPVGSDGYAKWAFMDDNNKWWTTKWNSVSTGGIAGGTISETNPIYIQMKFTDSDNQTVSQNVKKITYLPRPNNQGHVGKDYQVLVADKTNGTVQDSDFVVVAQGIFQNTGNLKQIVLPYSVKATHVRLQFTSSWQSNKILAALRIRFYKNLDDTDSSGSQIKNVSDLIKSADTTMGTVECTGYTGTKIVQDYSKDVTLNAIPVSGYQFVKWIVTDLDDGEAEPEVITEQNPSVTLDGRHMYTAQFAKTTIKEQGPFYLKMWSVDTDLTSNKKELNITVEKTDGLADVEWTSTNEEVAKVEKIVESGSDESTTKRAEVTAVGEGETTIKATLGDDYVLAQWTVNVEDTTTATTEGETSFQEELADIIADVKGDETDEKEALTDDVLKYKYKYRSDGDYKTAFEAFRNAYNAAKTDTTKSISELSQNLTEAYNNLQPLYKVTVDISNIEGMNIKDVTLESKYTTDNSGDESWLAGSDETSKWIYVPMIEKVAVSVPETVNTTDGTSKKFTQWNDITTGNAVKAANAREYSFYIVDNYIYKPEYTASAPVSDIINYCKTKYTKSTKKLSFVAKRNVPRTYIIKSHGVVITDKIGWDNFYANHIDRLKPDETRTRKSVANKNAHSGTYEAILTPKQTAQSTEWHGRSFITYVEVDEKGNEIANSEKTVYSEVAHYYASTTSGTN